MGSPDGPVPPVRLAAHAMAVVLLVQKLFSEWDLEPRPPGSVVLQLMPKTPNAKPYAVRACVGHTAAADVLARRAPRVIGCSVTQTNGANADYDGLG